MLANTIADTLQKKIAELGLPLAVDLWNEKKVIGKSPPRATLKFSSPSTLMLLANPSLGKFAESYVEGRVDFSGRIRDVIDLLLPLIGLPDSTQRKANFNKLKFWRHSRFSDRKAISSHYDVSNEFYALWLDERRVYSCAYFKNADDSLDQAQANKLDHICRKLMLKPGERFLDIGCGWGGLILWAAENYGVSAVGITISQNQFDYVTDYVRSQGLTGKVEIRLMDYRDLPESEPFDKIASVGMFEHVGVRNLPVYFRKINNLLKRGGLVMNHGITSVSFDDEIRDEENGKFIDKYVFPDGELTHISKVLEIMAREGLECSDVENLRIHYAKTLWHWVDRLETNQEQALALVGEKKFRIWRTYMAGFAVAFERNWDALHQVLASKPNVGGYPAYPLTRDYMYLR
ncbi:MAG: cyclopropane-fatty-acyl-phospholipid synthase family protein [Pseudomonadota bacterium]|nr:cyclopropane-fatty-acyl-phospholipid synthase family protein [Pseudomonadota bacterium]